MARRIRPRITVTVDPDMLDEIDAYIKEHAGSDRSQIVDEALQGWYVRIIQEALVRQHAAPKSTEELAERAAWKQIRAAQLARREHKATLGATV